MCDKAVDDFLPALKFVPDWFVTNKMLEKLDDTLFANDDIIFINEGSNNVKFFGGEIGILSVDLDKTNLNDVNFDEDNPETISHVRLLAWRNKFEKHKALKKRYKQKINVCSMASYKMAGSVLVQR